MSDPNNLFDDLIRKKLGDFELPGSEDDWHQLEKDLDKKSFWESGFKHFNIYYASVITLFLGMMCFGVFTNIDHPSEKNVKDSILIRNTNDVSATDSSSDAYVEKNKIKKDFILPTPVRSKKNTSNALSNTNANDTLINVKDLQKDTTSALIKPLAVDSIQKKKVTKQKKTIVIPKRDTVFVADTLRKIRRK